MINEIKDEKNKHMNEFQENSKSWNEIKKTKQNMKQGFNKNTEILKKNQIEILEMKSSVNWIKKLIWKFLK
jgi:hypothetical protein